MTSETEVEAIIKAASDGANRRVLSNIEIIVGICREQEKRGSTDFSIATIGMLSDERGGIKEQSIRNDKHRRFSSIIKAFDEKNKKKKSTSAIRDDDWIERIEDSNCQWLARELRGDNKRLKAEVQLLKETANVTIDLRENSVQSNSPNDQPKLSPIMIKALKHFISKEHLQELEFKVSEHGELIGRDGEVLSKVGFIHAIEQILLVEDDTDS